MSLIMSKKHFKKIKSRFSIVSFCPLIAFVTLSLLFYVSATPIAGEEQIYNNIIRFHILANSDTEQDQILKLSVRDKIVDYTTTLLDNVNDLNEARVLLTDNKDEIITIAQKVISDNGFHYTVSAKLCKEIYPTRVYSDYVFPAGEYNSLKIKIGNGEGTNWWCVLFPPLCTAGAVREEFTNSNSLSEIGFSDEEIHLISENDNIRTEIRFFALELINKLKTR